MRPNITPRNLWQWLMVILFIIAAVVVQLNKTLKPLEDAPADNSKEGRSGPLPKVSRGPVQKSAPRAAAGEWQTFTGCTLIEHRNNDGDSFDLLCGGEKLTVRLYFVDCPEKRRHQYNGDRIADQARYFGCSEDHAVATGEAARDFAEGFLRNDRVSFTTRMESVFDSERVYGFVSVGGQDMGEALVARGMARIYTKGEDPPGPATAREEKDKLLKLEREAKAKALGGWRRQ